MTTDPHPPAAPRSITAASGTYPVSALTVFTAFVAARPYLLAVS